eukprot:TRINITY_DN11715_c0_g1_i1.p1 TRINITY_DN11715_c0_g1~~TRINITY_DN11715_c0_g1_i1.p1  ORF type:complete len:498 (-),score=84.15 TRINITY_DN11715_c0_g1_i1:222-1715(-)
MNSAAFEYGLTLTKAVDSFFGAKNKTVMSQRDVPGLTQAAIPLLRKNGIVAVSIGANQAVAPSPLPKIFVWKDATQEHDIIQMYHPGGYGGIALTDCVFVDGFSDALCMAVNGDNRGPPNVTEVQQTFATISAEFPNAKVVASTFDEFINIVLDANWKPKLPIVTQEIGDTWIYGVQSDPLKVAQYREVARLRSRCIEVGFCDINDAAFYDFSRLFFKVYEHTWGFDVKNYLIDWTNWSNEDFNNVIDNNNFQIMISSWIEQRAYITGSIDALLADPKYHPFMKELQFSLSRFQDHSPPSLKGYSNSTGNMFSVFNCGRFDLQFSSRGSIISLFDNQYGTQWASDNNEIALYHYETYDKDDFDVFLGTYLSCFPPTCYWGPLDFGKPNVSLGSPNHTVSYANLQELWTKEDGEGYKFVLKMTTEDIYSQNYGAPSVIYTTIRVSNKHGAIDVDFQWQDKRATRLPESLWLSFNPVVEDPSLWRLQKLDRSRPDERGC